MGGDDALSLLPRSSEQFEKLVDQFFVIGGYPWEETSSSRVLYSFPNTDAGGEYIPFCFPQGRRTIVKTYLSRADLFNSVFSGEELMSSSRMTLYSSGNSRSPFLFCFKYMVSPITFPMIASDVSLIEILSTVKDLTVPLTEICLAVKAKLPFDTLFNSIAAWIVECERIARLEMAPFFDSVLMGGSSLKLDVIVHRERFTRVLSAGLSQAAPDRNESVEIDVSPYPPFRWTRPGSVCSYFSLARRCFYSLLSNLSPANFVKLFSCVVLEKSVIVFHDDPETVTHMILALHYMIRPLRWVGGSVSILPDSLMDLVSAPSAVLIGTAFPLELCGVDVVYVDTQHNDIQVGSRTPEYPRSQAMLNEISDIWESANSPDHPDLNRLIMAANLAVKDMLGPVQTSIMTDFSESQDVQTQFMDELFLAQADRRDRAYLKALSSTQMFRLHIEQECRKRSDGLKVSRENESGNRRRESCCPTAEPLSTNV
jgi:hypothetical protein